MAAWQNSSDLVCMEHTRFVQILLMMMSVTTTMLIDTAVWDSLYGAYLVCMLLSPIIVRMKHYHDIGIHSMMAYICT